MPPTSVDVALQSWLSVFAGLGLSEFRNWRVGPRRTEVIVADGVSKDKTLQIARDYGCKIVPGGRPSKGRNQGAGVALGDILFFVDSDTILSENFLENTLKEFQERKLDVAGFFLEPYERKYLKLLYNLFYNWWPALALNTPKLDILSMVVQVSQSVWILPE